MRGTRDANGTGLGASSGWSAAGGRELLREGISSGPCGADVWGRAGGVEAAGRLQWAGEPWRRSQLSASSSKVRDSSDVAGAKGSIRIG